MRQIVIDGLAINSADELYDFLAEELNFPDYFGRNLDALYDCLTDICEPTQFSIIHISELHPKLGRLAFLLPIVIRDAADENPFLTLAADWPAKVSEY